MEESVHSDDEYRNLRMQPQHSAIKRRVPVTKKGLGQEAWDQWLGENKTPTYINRVELMQSDHACDSESAAAAHTKMGIPQPEARGPQAYTQDPTRPRTGQTPTRRGNGEDHIRRNAQRKITTGKKAC